MMVKIRLGAIIALKRKEIQTLVCQGRMVVERIVSLQCNHKQPERVSSTHTYTNPIASQRDNMTMRWYPAGNRMSCSKLTACRANERVVSLNH